MMKLYRRNRRNRHATSHNRPDFLPLCLLTLGIIGYETIALTVSYLNVPSRAVSVPYRVAVVALALAIIGKCFFAGGKMRMSVPLLVFFVAYLIRLINDLFFTNLFTNVMGAEFAIQFFATGVLLPTLAICLTYRAGDDDIIIAKAVLIMGAVFLALTLWGRSSGVAADNAIEAGRLGFSAVNPISLGHAAACVVLSAIYLILQKSTSNIVRAICGLIVVAGSFVLLETNSRGPLIGFSLALVWYALSNSGRLALFMPAALLVSLGGIATVPAIQRVLQTVEGGWAFDQSSLGRLEIQEQAIQDFLEAPAFGMHYINPMFGALGTPHNIIIESAMALGIIGASLLVYLFVVAGLKITQYYGKQHALLTMLFLQHAVNSQLSGAIWSAAAFFMLLGVIVSSKNSRGKMPLASSLFYIGDDKESARASATGQ